MITVTKTVKNIYTFDEKELNKLYNKFLEDDAWMYDEDEISLENFVEMYLETFLDPCDLFYSLEPETHTKEEDFDVKRN